MSVLHRSIFFSALERYGTVLLFLISTAVLSRLLTPAEFGVYAIVNALTMVIAASFQEFGGANYLIQKPLLSEQDIRTAFTITFCMSATIGLSLFALRDVLAWFFANEGLKFGIGVSVLTFFVSPFTLTISALFRRDMQFGTLTVCNLAGNVTTAVISIGLAAMNFSFMAPIWGLFAGNIVIAGSLVVSRRNLRIFRPSIDGYRAVMNFGFFSAGVSVINVFYNLAPQLVLARVLDFAAVGLYSRAVNVTQMFDKFVLQILNPVIMPAIFAQTRSGGDLKRLYLNAIELIAAIQWPFLIFLALMADPIIRIWLGVSWIEIVPLVRMLCIASLSLFAACLTYPVLVAVGRVNEALTSSLISLPPSLLLIFVASFFGIQAVAASALLTLPFQAAVAIYFVSGHLKVSRSDLVDATLKSGVVTICSSAGIIVSAVLAQNGLIGPIVELILAGVLAAAGWLVGLIMTRHPLLARVQSAAVGLLDLVRRMRSDRIRNLRDETLRLN